MGMTTVQEDHDDHILGQLTQARGFTLIELLITVAIIGILSAIAIPSYNDYVVRSKLVEAVNGLMSLRVKLEQHYQDHRSYGPAGGNCGLPASSFPAGKYFAFTCLVGATDQEYVVRAKSRANVGLGNEGDYEYSVDQSDVRATPYFRGVAETVTCWLKKRGDTC